MTGVEGTKGQLKISKFRSLKEEFSRHEALIPKLGVTMARVGASELG